MTKIQLTEDNCNLFQQPFFQFAQWKKFAPEQIPQLKATYQAQWQQWKSLILQLSMRLGAPFANPHIESWTNGWQLRAHFFAYFKYQEWQNSAAILSIILNRRRLQVCLDWHCYRADRSQIELADYNRWLSQLDPEIYADFDIWHGDDSEYNDFRPLHQFSIDELRLRHQQDFFCIGKNLERTQLANHDSLDFLYQNLRALLPLYEACHQDITAHSINK